MNREERFSAFWASFPTPKDICSVPGCVNKRSWKGICNAHSHRLVRYGDVNGGTQRLSGELIRWLQKSWKIDTDDCQIWPFPDDGSGYPLFTFKGKTLRAHKFACDMFHGPQPSTKHHAAHECGNSLCVNPKHISWKTALENMADKYRHGTNLQGEKHHRSKLNYESVEEIRKLAISGKSRKEIAEIFSVKLSTVEDLLSGKTWRQTYMTDETFNKFWAAYPSKKGKGDAIKAFKTAIKLASLEEMLDGISRYVANKPDWQAYKHPASWLRGQNWSDEWEPQQPKAPRYKDSYVQYNVDRYSTAPEQPQRPVLPKNHFLNTYGK